MKKHAIIADFGHVFTQLYCDVLSKKCNINMDLFLFIHLSQEGRVKEGDVNILESRDVDFDVFSDIETITFISLNPSNSSFIEELFTYSTEAISKTHIYVTDDELDRWRRCQLEHNEIVADTKYFISDSCVKVIPKVVNFIALDLAFKEPLEAVLGRDDFKIINARDPFWSMPTAHVELLGNILNLNTRHDITENSILIGSKRGVFGLLDVISIIQSFYKSGILSKYKFHLFTYKKKKSLRVLIDLYCMYVRIFKREIVDIGYPVAMNSLAYTNIVMSCSHFIMQGRGGISTARSYLRYGRGVIAVKSSTPNKRELVDALGVNALVYNSYDELAELIKNTEVDVIENQNKMKLDLERSYAELKKLYC